MARADVAYESNESKEARRKALRAVKPLRWHRSSGAVGGYRADGARGKYFLSHRSPDRRRGIFPWVVKAGGQEIKVGGFDSKSEAQVFASQFDAGLCGQTQTIIVPAGAKEAGPLTSGNYNEPSKKYEDKVIDAVAKMIPQKRGKEGTPLPTDYDAYQIVGNSPEYVSQMERGGVDPTIVAAVLVATKDHHHAHDCPGKHVELAESVEEHGHLSYPKRHLKTLVLRGQPVEVYFGGHSDSWHYMLPSGAKKGGFESEDDAVVHAQRALGMLSSASVAVEAAESKRRPQPDPSSGYYITKSSLTKNYFLMKGKTLIGEFNSRDEALEKAKELSSPKG